MADTAIKQIGCNRWLRPIFLNPQNVLLITFASIALISTITHFLGVVGWLGPYLGIAFASLTFSLVPGYLLANAIGNTRTRPYDFLPLILLSTSLGLTWNFFFNIFVVMSGISIARAIPVYLIAVCAGYGILLFWINLRSDWHQVNVVRCAPLTSLAIVTVIGIIFVAVLHRDPTYIYVEELAIVRKLQELPYIAFDNVSWDLGDRTTYIFFPFYLFVSMVTKFLGVDTFVGYFALWPVIALLSLACLAKLTQLLSGRGGPAVILLVLAACATIFYEVRPSVFRVDVLPLPDRYAIAPALLLSLALFHFFIFVDEEKANFAMLAGLIYLILENTFIHAKETLYLLGMVTIYAGLLRVRPIFDRQRFVRVSAVIAIVLSAVVGYAAYNVSGNPDLLGYLSHHREHFTQLFWRTWQQDGIGTFFMMDDTSSGYHRMIRQIFAVGETTWLLPFFLFMPLYVARSSTLNALFFPVVISAIALVMMSDGVVLLIGMIAAEPDILRPGHTITVLCLIVAADIAWTIGAMLVGYLRDLWHQAAPLGTWEALTVGWVVVVAGVTYSQPQPTIAGGSTITGYALADVALFATVFLMSLVRLRGAKYGA